MNLEYLESFEDAWRREVYGDRRITLDEFQSNFKELVKEGNRHLFVKARQVGMTTTLIVHALHSAQHYKKITHFVVPDHRAKVLVIDWIKSNLAKMGWDINIMNGSQKDSRVQVLLPKEYIIPNVSPDDVIFDEFASFSDSDARKSIEFYHRHHENKKLIIASTPRRESLFNNIVIGIEEAPNSDISLHKITHREGVLSPDQVVQLRKQVPEDVFKEMMECNIS